MTLLRRIQREAVRDVFIGDAPTDEHKVERAKLATRFEVLAKEAGAKRDFDAFAREVLLRHLRGERRNDKMTKWAEDVFALREDEAEVKREQRRKVSA